MFSLYCIIVYHIILVPAPGRPAGRVVKDWPGVDGVLNCVCVYG